eukprot:7784438-Pyramimonas_sp.AAC.1
MALPDPFPPAGAALASIAKPTAPQATQGQGCGPSQTQSHQRSGPRRAGGGRRGTSVGTSTKRNQAPAVPAEGFSEEVSTAACSLVDSPE